MNGALTRILLRGGLIISVLSIATLAAYASHLEPSLTYGTFNVNGIDLKIDSKSWYNGATVPSATWALKNLTPGADKFFNFDDVKPGDSGCTVISMHVKKGEAWLCIDFKNLLSKENTLSEPELPDTSTNGELASNLQMFGWLDNGDNKYKTGEKTIFGTTSKPASIALNNKSYAVGDSSNGSSCKKDQARYVGLCWCAGILKMNPTNGTYNCDGSALGNIAQTDSVNIDISIRATSAQDNKKFLCDPTPTPPSSPKTKYCSHGYWKQSNHFDNWTSYSQNKKFSSVFDNAFPGMTLLQVLKQGGGELNELGRETVGALLNAGKFGSNFPYTQAQVISMFNATYPGNNSSYRALVAKFKLAENCPLK